MKKVTLFALSTCAWCRMTRRFLDENNIEHQCIYVDILSGDEKKAALDEMSKHNPRRIFPTVVIDDSTVIVGFKENLLREALGL